MLVKCVCTNCGHSYLGDDQAADLACPRCGVGNEAGRNPSDIPDAPGGPVGFDPYAPLYGEGHGVEEFEYAQEPHFAPQAPPPMYLSGDRLVKGFIFGLVFTVLAGAVVGGALASVRILLPALAAAILGVVAGAACRYGFGGRSSAQTKTRAAAIATLVTLIGMAALLGGGWAIERMTGTRAAQTRDDLELGLRSLTRQRTRGADAGTAIMLDQRIGEVERLRALSDAQIEDYLWTQEAQVRVAPLAHAKLRLTVGPTLRLGANGKTKAFEPPITGAIFGAEVLLALILALRCVWPKA